MGSIMLGVDNLINSTLEIILYYSSQYKHDSKTKSVLDFLLDSISNIKDNIPRYYGMEAKGQVIDCEESKHIEKKIRECLLTVFDIDIQDRKKYMSSDKIRDYREYVSSLLDEVVKCKSHIIYERVVIPTVKSNEALKRANCRHSKLFDIWEKSRSLSAEEFGDACFYLKFDSHALKEVIDLYSEKLILALVDMAYIKSLVENRYFPPANEELNKKVENSYTRLVNHIVLHKYFQSLIQYGTDGKTETLLPGSSRKDVERDITAFRTMCQYGTDGKLKPLSSNKRNVKRNITTCLGITLSIIQLLFNFSVLLLVLMHVNNVVDLISLEYLSIGMCSVNIVLVTMSVVLVCVSKKSCQEDANSVISHLAMERVDVHTEEGVNL